MRSVQIGLQPNFKLQGLRLGISLLQETKIQAPGLRGELGRSQPTKSTTVDFRDTLRCPFHGLQDD